MHTQLGHHQAVEDCSAVRLLGQLLLDRQAVLHGVADVQSRPLYPPGDIADGIGERSRIAIRPRTNDGPATRRRRLSAFPYDLVEDERAVSHATNAIDAHLDGTAE